MRVTVAYAAPGVEAVETLTLHAGATVPDIQKLAAGSLNRAAFWAQSYLDPPESFSLKQ